MKQNRWRKIRVGVMVTIAGVILLVFIMLIDERGGIFASYAELKASFNTVSGLRKGAIVYLRGVDIGEVSDIYYEKKGVTVKMNVLSRVLHHIPEDSVAVIKTQGLLGDKMVEIKPGESPYPVKSGAVLKGEAEGELYENLAEAGNVVRKTKLVVEELYKIVKSVKEGEGTIGRLFVDDTLYRELSNTVRSVNQLTLQLKKTSAELDAAVAAFKKEMVNEHGIKKFNEILTQLELLSKDLRIVVLSLKEGRGTAGKLLTDEDFYKQLKETVDTLKSLIEDIKKNPSKYVKFELF